MEDDDKGGGPEMVPKARLDQVRRQHRETAARVTELEGQLEAAQPRLAAADTLTEQLGDLRSRLEASETARKEDASIFGAGFTDPDLVRFEHSRLPEKGRPALAEWLPALKPDTAPLSLRPFLAGEQQKADADTTDTTGGGGTTGGANNGAGTPRGQGGQGGDAQKAKLKRIYAEATKTGDWSEWRKARGLG